MQLHKTNKRYKVIPGEDCFTQHYVQVADWNLMTKTQLTDTKISKQVKLWRLKEETK